MLACLSFKTLTCLMIVNLGKIFNIGEWNLLLQKRKVRSTDIHSNGSIRMLKRPKYKWSLQVAWVECIFVESITVGKNAQLDFLPLVHSIILLRIFFFNNLPFLVKTYFSYSFYLLDSYLNHYNFECFFPSLVRHSPDQNSFDRSLSLKVL